MSLLVPIDLSAPSRTAVALAALIGGALHQDVLLLHVSEDTPSLDLLAELHGVAEPVRAAGLRARLRTMKGQPRQVICQEAARRNSPWIIMGTRGQASTHNAPTGSVARAVMECSTVAVAAVRPGPRVLELARAGEVLGLIDPKAHRGSGGAAHRLASRLMQATGARLDSAPAPGRVLAAAVLAWNPGAPEPHQIAMLADTSRPVVLVSEPSA